MLCNSVKVNFKQTETHSLSESNLSLIIYLKSFSLPAIPYKLMVENICQKWKQNLVFKRFSFKKSKKIFAFFL